MLGVRGGVFWQWACGASPVLVIGVTLREPRLDIWQWSQAFAEKIGRVGCAWLRFFPPSVSGGFFSYGGKICNNPPTPTFFSSPLLDLSDLSSIDLLVHFC